MADRGVRDIGATVGHNRDPQVGGLQIQITQYHTVNKDTRVVF